ncbi:hypothetical protein QBC47DRAFT_31199 [Echria macrotheca]|uniref:C2H2-type domain-containing protein n=1 Tax=Echria macrotheca TaxID=438768 RepID=A0AAJ0FFN4_9PEZI|nr:hypothetical protein QBC47DRAFT_31199 [Echria macrotheca]
MDHSAVPTSAAEAGHAGVLETPATEATPMGAPAALPDKTVLNSRPESQDFIVLADKNIDPDQQVERKETWESIQSSIARTSTGFSQSSYSTEHTELDIATSHDDAEEHQHASAFALRCRSCTSTFHSSTSSRTPSFPLPDRDDMQRPNHPDMIPEADMPASPRRGSWRARLNRAPTQPGPHPLSVSTPAVNVDEMDAEPSSSHDSPDPTPIQTRAPGNQLMDDPDALAEDDDEWTTAELSPSHMSDSSDTLDDTDAVPQQPDERLNQDVCDGLLKHLFGVELGDLTSADAALVQNSVRYCMQELFRVVPAGLASFPPINQAAGYGESNGASAPGSGNNANSGNNGQGSGRGGSKRGPDGQQHLGGDGSGDRGRRGNSKKPKLETAQSSQAEDKFFSCPYRKRNPVKFNVRDHQNCAVQSFPDISQLKRHVKIFHKIQPIPRSACPRCKLNFSTHEELQRHLATPNEQICTFRDVQSSGDPEDGIDAKIEDLLNGRRTNTKVDSWEILWRTLFPHDEEEDIPDPVFVAPIELDEMQLEFQQDKCSDQLRKLISEEEVRAAKLGYDVATHVEAIVAICQEHIESSFEAFRKAKAEDTQAKERRRRARGKSNGQEPADGNHLSVMSPSQVGYAGDSGHGSPSSQHTNHSAGSWFELSAIQQGLVPAPGMPVAPGAYGDVPHPSIQGVTVPPPNHSSMAHQIGNSSFTGHSQALHHFRAASGDSGINFGPPLPNQRQVYNGAAPMSAPTNQFSTRPFQASAMGAGNVYPTSSAPFQAMPNAGPTFTGNPGLQFDQQMSNSPFQPDFSQQRFEDGMDN